MRRMTRILGLAAFVVGGFVVQADAATYPFKNACPRGELNYTPLVHKAACNGASGYCGCGPGFISACAPRCCRCVPCG